jgi:hypothetical protein
MDSSGKPGGDGAMSAEDRRGAVLDRLRAALADPDLPGKVEAAQAARTDQWRWYCRLCGEEGSDPLRAARDGAARAHVEAAHGLAHLGQAEAGRLLHVWSYQ